MLRWADETDRGSVQAEVGSALSAVVLTAQITFVASMKRFEAAEVGGQSAWRWSRCCRKGVPPRHLPGQMPCTDAELS